MATLKATAQSKPATKYQEVSANQIHGLLTRLAQDLLHLHDWLSGPAMTDAQRLNRDIAETELMRHLGPLGF